MKLSSLQLSHRRQLYSKLRSKVIFPTITRHFPAWHVTRVLYFVDQSALGGWYGQYYACRLHFSWTLFPVPILGCIDLRGQVNLIVFSAGYWIHGSAVPCFVVDSQAKLHYRLPRQWPADKSGCPGPTYLKRLRLYIKIERQSNLICHFVFFFNREQDNNPSDNYTPKIVIPRTIIPLGQLSNRQIYP